MTVDDAIEDLFGRIEWVFGLDLSDLGDISDEQRVTLGMAASAAFLWTSVVAGWFPMPGTSQLPMAMSDPGAAEFLATHSGAAGTLAYLTMWGSMMSAMMYPAMVPFARRYVGSVEGSTLEKSLATTTVFVAYSVVWTLTGVVPISVDALIGINGLVTNHASLVVGAALLLAGGYQVTGAKRRSLDRCCGGLDAREFDLRSAFRTGLERGRDCVRCTWALFTLMVVVGSMNLFWMVALTLIVTIERVVPWGEDVATATGLLGVLAGLVVIVAGIPVFG